MAVAKPNTKCSRCGRSTKSPKAQVCRSCFGRGPTRSWLASSAVSNDQGCLLVTVLPQHSDGKYRATVLTEEGEGGTKTSAILHMLFNEVWGFEPDNTTDLLPVKCGNYNCINQDHWALVVRKSDRERLREILTAWDSACAKRETGDLFSDCWPTFKAVMDETRRAVK